MAISEPVPGAFDAHLPFGARPALLIIDAVMAYLTPGSPLYDARFEAALTSLTRLTAAARAACLPVVFTGCVYHADGLDGGLFYRKVPALKLFRAGESGGAFPPQLRPQPEDLVVMKQYPSAFFGTSLASSLTAMQIDCLIIGGFSTSGCVRASAVDALQHGFAPYIVASGCGDRSAGPHEASLFDLQAKYAEVVGEMEALTLIAGAARLRVARTASPMGT